jgi:hypothetical protein
MITLRFRYNPAAETADVNEPQIWAHEQFPAITVKSVSAAWNFVRKYRDEAAEVVENEILEVTADEGTDLTRIPSAIIFKRNTKGKLEFKDYDKMIARETKKEIEAAKAAADTVTENA